MNVTTLLSEPLLKGQDMFGPDRIRLHKEILGRKPMIREVFHEFYDTCHLLDETYFEKTEGDRVELGAGTSLFKHYYPNIISTDVEAAPHLDGVIDAQKMAFTDSSIRSLYGINCFHHFSEPTVFFQEVRRVVKPGGGFILIDPHFSFFSQFLYKRLFKSEGYDIHAQDWSYCATQDTKAEALPNQALSYLVLFRDRKKFQTLFPDLEIVHTHVMPSFLRYLLSGGLNFRQLAPNWMAPLLKVFEKLPLVGSLLGLHHVIVIRKKIS